MQGMYSMRSPAVKRLMKEAQELREPTEQYACHPLEDNLFEWHFTIRGPADSEFEGGLYHGRIILPPEYPMKPPSIIILTPNGRFEVNKKICLSISGHHPESWQPSWSLRTAMLAIIGFMPTHGAGALGSLDYSPEERKLLAKKSRDFKCPSCGCINNILKPVTEESKKTTEEARELAAQIDFKDEKEKNAALKSSNQNVKPAEEGTPNVEDNKFQTSPLAAPAGSQAFPSQQFGQFPFRMPFFPPFPQMHSQMNSQNGTGASSQVPRFPLPFVSPFYPPLMHSGNLPMFPMMPGGQVPPWLQNRSATAGTKQSQPSETASAAPKEKTPTSLSSPSTTSNTSASNEDNDSQTEPETIQRETATNTSINTTTPTAQAELRQRNVAPTRQTSIPHRGHYTPEQEHRETQRGDRFLLLFAVFVVIILALLLLRRLHMMKLISFSF